MPMDLCPRPAVDTAVTEPTRPPQVQTEGKHWGTYAPGDQSQDTVRRCLGDPLEDGSQASSTRMIAELLGSPYQQKAQLIGVLRAPQANLPQFDGDPMKYFPFIGSFEDNVEKTLIDNSSRLACLVQLCTWDAARVIEFCNLMPPDLEYQKTCQSSSSSSVTSSRSPIYG